MSAAFHLALTQEEAFEAAAVALALSLVVAAVVLGWAGNRYPDATVGAYVVFGGLAVFASLLSLIALIGALTLTITPAPRALVGESISVLSGIVAVLALTPRVRQRVSRLLPSLDPNSPVHAIVIGLYALVLLQQLGGQVATDQVQALSQLRHSPSLAFILGTNQLPMLIVAFAGVGLFVNRPLASALARLGLRAPSPRSLLLSIAIIAGLLALGFGFDALSGVLAPQQTKQIEKVSNLLLSNVSTVPTVIALGLGAGIGEEILFRGALVPRLGILPSALLFASLHTQYAISIPTLEILVLGIVLGWLRRRTGTSECIVVHSGYDIVVGLLTLLR